MPSAIIAYVLEVSCFYVVFNIIGVGDFCVKEENKDIRDYFSGQGESSVNATQIDIQDGLAVGKKIRFFCLIAENGY